MTRGARGPGLPEWVDQLGDLLGAYFAEPAHWQAAQERARREVFNVDEQMQRRSEAGRAILLAAWRLAKESYSPDFDHTLFIGPGAQGLANAIAWWAAAAAEHVQPTMAAHWGDCLPAGLPRLELRRKKRLVAAALQQGSHRSMTDIAQQLGMSRATLYNLMGRKEGED